MKLDRTKLNRSLLGATHKYLLVPHLEVAISEGEFEWTHTFKPKGKDTAWHPSSDCTPSLEQLYLKATGQGQDHITTSLWKTFTVGHFWHGYLQNILYENLEFCDALAIERRDSRIWEWENTEIPKPFCWVTGAADVAPVSIPNHGDFLLDIKTMNSHDFKSGYAPKWTVEKWECQVNIYMDFFDLERAIILGVQKDTPHDFKEFHFTRNQPLIDALYNKWKLVALCLDEGVIPPAEEEIELPLKGPK